jgi:hypothetical protein
MNNNLTISKKLVKILIDNNAFSNMEKLECPECYSIEDEEYCCTTCWNHNLSFQNIIQSLYDTQFNHVALNFNCLNIINENDFDSTLTIHYYEDTWNDFVDLNIINPKEYQEEQYIDISIDDIIAFLINKGI